MGDFHKHWRISVESHGDLIVAIETECLAGRELSETDVATVNHAISHLNGFMGNPGTITALEAGNKRLREALKWYADEENWKRHSVVPKMPCSAVYDSGERARKALEERGDD